MVLICTVKHKYIIIGSVLTGKHELYLKYRTTLDGLRINSYPFYWNQQANGVCQHMCLIWINFPFWTTSYSFLRAKSEWSHYIASQMVLIKDFSCQVLSMLCSYCFQLWLRACCILCHTTLLFMSLSYHCQKEYDIRK